MILQMTRTAGSQLISHIGDDDMAGWFPGINYVPNDASEEWGQASSINMNIGANIPSSARPHQVDHPSHEMSQMLEYAPMNGPTGSVATNIWNCGGQDPQVPARNNSSTGENPVIDGEACFSHRPQGLHPQKRKVDRTEKSRQSARQGRRKERLSKPRCNEVQPPMRLTTSGQQNPDKVTVAVCCLWLSKNPHTMPPEHILSCLAHAFGDSIDALRNWFLRDLRTGQSHEDTGYQTMTSSDSHIASSYRRNRRECNRKASVLRREGASPIQFERDESRPYACTSRCGAMFSKKDAWKRHEEINRPPRLWLCRFQACEYKLEKKRVYFRKDRFRAHLTNDHEYAHPTDAEIEACCMPIESNFDKSCIFRQCETRFNTWKERINHIANHLRRPWNMFQWRDPDHNVDNIEDAEGSDEESLDSGLPEDEDGLDDTDKYTNNDEDDEDNNGGLGPPATGNEPGAGPYGANSEDSRRDERSNKRQNTGASGGTTGQGYSNSGSSKHFYGSWKRSRKEPTLAVDENSTLIPHFSQNRTKLPATNCLKIVTLGPLGSSQRATVDEVRVHGYDRTMAWKIVYYSRPETRAQCHHEISCMKKLRHRHVVHLIMSFENTNSMTMFMQPVADYNLFQYLNACSLAEPFGVEIWTWFGCLLTGLQYLHENGVRHRDIKPSNLLVKNNQILYTDFGLSCWVSEDEPLQSDTDDFTEGFAAPEVYQGRRGRAADVYSLGCVLLEMVTVIVQRPHEGLWQAFRDEQHRVTSGNSHLSTMELAIRWNNALRVRAAASTAAVRSLAFLDMCEAMMRKQSEERPTAAYLAEQILPHRCCDAVLDLSLGQPRRLLTASQDTAICPDSEGEMENTHEDGESKNLTDINTTTRSVPSLAGSDSNTLSDLSSVKTITSDEDDDGSYGEKKSPAAISDFRKDKRIQVKCLLCFRGDCKTSSNPCIVSHAAPAEKVADTGRNTYNLPLTSETMASRSQGKVSMLKKFEKYGDK